MHSCNYRLRNCAMSSLTVHGQLCKSCSLEFWTVNWIALSKGMHNATLQITRKTNLNCQYSRWIIHFQTKTPHKRDHREGEMPFFFKTHVTFETLRCRKHKQFCGNKLFVRYRGLIEILRGKKKTYLLWVHLSMGSMYAFETLETQNCLKGTCWVYVKNSSKKILWPTYVQVFKKILYFTKEHYGCQRGDFKPIYNWQLDTLLNLKIEL